MKISVTVAVLVLPFLTVFSAPAEKTVAAAIGNNGCTVRIRARANKG